MHAAFHDINDLGLAALGVDASGGDDDHRQEGPPVGGAIGANVRASICGGRRQASLYGRLQWPEVRNNAPSLGGEKPSPLSDVFSGATGGGDA